MTTESLKVKRPRKNKGKSPYKKYGKTPFRYSNLFYEWKEAAARGNTGLARELGRKHSDQHFGVAHMKECRKKFSLDG